MAKTALLILPRSSENRAVLESLIAEWEVILNQNRDLMREIFQSALNTYSFWWMFRSDVADDSKN